ncbi:glycosyltransferase [Methylobacterium oryzihabitans]|uniref:glycosyltransferase n=1 Tax=Methylobacterium oryzihabitans TaxID=2499852 RepID=UPI0026AFA7A2
MAVSLLRVAEPLPEAPPETRPQTVPVAEPVLRQRILHVFRAPVGGLFRHVVDAARMQAEAGHEVGLFCDSLTGGARAEAALAGLAPRLALGLTRVPMRRNPHATDLAALVRLHGLVRRIRPTVLHGHGSKGGLYARLVPGPFGVAAPVRAYTPHGGSFNYHPGTPLHRLYMAVEGLLSLRTDVFLFESAYIAGRHRAFVGPTDRLVRIVHNGLDTAEFAPIAPAAERHDLVYIGELREAKGVPVLFDALARLRDHGRVLSLLVVGSGPDEATLKARVAELGLDGAVTFEPPQPIRQALSRGTVMVVPSLAESLPYVVLEAVAAAQPLVSTDVGGIPEILGPAADALVPPNDFIALAGALARKLDQSPEARAGEAAALSAFVRCRFSMRQMTDDGLAGYAAARPPSPVPAQA